MPIADIVSDVWETPVGAKTAICAVSEQTFAIAAPAVMTVRKFARTAWRNAPIVQRNISVRAVIGVSTVRAAKASSA